MIWSSVHTTYARRRTTLPKGRTTNIPPFNTRATGSVHVIYAEFVQMIVLKNANAASGGVANATAMQWRKNTTQKKPDALSTPVQSAHTHTHTHPRRGWHKERAPSSWKMQTISHAACIGICISTMLIKNYNQPTARRLCVCGVFRCPLMPQQQNTIDFQRVCLNAVPIRALCSVYFVWVGVCTYDVHIIRLFCITHTKSPQPCVWVK